MTTFTLRVSNSLADRLSSAQMRAWIGEFLRGPRPLPPDPGPGDRRMSLTLAADQVKQLAAVLGCPPSSALRRLAAERTGFMPTTVPSSPPRSAELRASGNSAGQPTGAVARRKTKPSGFSARSPVVTIGDKNSGTSKAQPRVSENMTEKNSMGEIALALTGVVAFLAFLFFGFGYGGAPE